MAVSIRGETVVCALHLNALMIAHYLSCHPLVFESTTDLWKGTPQVVFPADTALGTCQVSDVKRSLSPVPKIERDLPDNNFAFICGLPRHAIGDWPSSIQAARRLHSGGSKCPVAYSPSQSCKPASPLLFRTSWDIPPHSNSILDSRVLPCCKRD